MYKIIYTKQAAKDIENLKRANLAAKTQNLIEVIRKNPFQKPPSFEDLRGNLKGFYSRRINIQHHLVHQVYQENIIEEDKQYDGIIKIVRMWTHYDGL